MQVYRIFIYIRDLLPSLILTIPFTFTLIGRDFSGLITSSEILNEGYILIGTLLSALFYLVFVITRMSSDESIMNKPLYLILIFIIFYWGINFSLLTSIDIKYFLGDSFKLLWPFFTFFLAFSFLNNDIFNKTMFYLFLISNICLVYEIITYYFISSFSVRYGTGIVFVAFLSNVYLYRNTENRSLLSALIGLCIFHSMLSGSRAAFLTILICSIWLFASNNQNYKNVFTYIFVSIILIILFIYTDSGTNITSRLTNFDVSNPLSIFSVDISFINRVIEARSVINSVGNPFFGSGIGSEFLNYRVLEATYANNHYVHMTIFDLYKNGGFILIFIYLFLSTKAFIQIKKNLLFGNEFFFLFIIILFWKFLLSSGSFYKYFYIFTFFSGYAYRLNICMEKTA